MTNPMTPVVRGKAAPREMTSTELKSRQQDVWDDARAGYVTLIVRGQNRKQVAAIVPPEIGVAYERQEPLPDHERGQILDAVEQARAEITATLDRLVTVLRGSQPPAAAEQADDDTPVGTAAAPIAYRQFDSAAGDDVS